MKKILIVCTLFAGMAMSASAQNSDQLVTKRGFKYLPKAGDLALGIDASPMLRFVGNMFNNTVDNSAPYFGGGDYAIYGKYFLKDNRALRVKLDLDLSSYTHQTGTNNDLPNSDPNILVYDKIKECYNYTGLNVGYEFRRGHGRVQGFYGVEARLGYSSRSRSYEYGNAMTKDNPRPTTSYLTTWGSRRDTKVKYPSSFSFGLGGFAGIEYFIAPQVSLGGELGLNFYLSTSNGKRKTTYEEYDSSKNKVIVTTEENENYTSEVSYVKLGTSTGNYGNLFLMFYF